MSTEILPSPAARKIYNMMVIRADVAGEDMHLSLAQSIELSVTLRRQGGHDEGTAVAELREAAWIAPVNDGGWKLA